MRLRMRERVQFVEVDRPDTQQHKQTVLSEQAHKPFMPVDYVAMDFSTHKPEAHITGLMREYRQRYFGARAGKMKGYEFYRVAMAVVRHNS